MRLTVVSGCDTSRPLWQTQQFLWESKTSRCGVTRDCLPSAQTNHFCLVICTTGCHFNKTDLKGKLFSPKSNSYSYFRPLCPHGGRWFLWSPVLGRNAHWTQHIGSGLGYCSQAMNGWARRRALGVRVQVVQAPVGPTLSRLGWESSWSFQVVWACETHLLAGWLVAAYSTHLRPQIRRSLQTFRIGSCWDKVWAQMTEGTGSCLLLARRLGQDSQRV